MNTQLMLWGLRNAKRAAWVLPFLPLTARAQLTDVKDPKVPFQNVAEIIESGFNIAVTVGGVVFVVLFLVAGVMYLVSAGNEEGTKKAKTLLVDAVIGLVLIVVAWAVGNYVLDLLNVEVGVENGTGVRGGALEN